MTRLPPAAPERCEELVLYSVASHHVCQAARPRHARNKWCWNLHATAVTRLPPHRNGVKNWCCILWPSALGNLVLHRLGEPVIHWRPLLPRHANVHVVLVILCRRFRRSRFGLCNHRFGGGLVPTRSRSSRRRGHPSCLAPGILGRTVCRLLLCGGLAVDLVMGAFPRLTLLALRAVALIMSLLATYKTLAVVVPLCFHIGSLGILE